jgi:hypothetical protein
MSDKQAVLEAVSQMPDSLTLAQIRQELAIMVEIRAGLADSSADRVIDHDEVKKRFTACHSN